MSNEKLQENNNYDSPHIFGDLNLTLAEFETREQNAISKCNDNRNKIENSCCLTNYTNFNTNNERKNDITLDLSLGNKNENLFGSDLTPTPTRFIRNCDEVGLFEDLRHVNPFDEDFRRAVEQNHGQNPIATPATTNSTQNDCDSLHTPQVYPLDATAGSDYCCNLMKSPIDLPIVEDLLVTTTSPINSSVKQTPTNNLITANEPVTTMPTVIPVGTQVSTNPIQIIQPQLITWVIPTQVQALSTEDQKISNSHIPVQTVRPFILPKPAIEDSKSKSKPKTKIKIPTITGSLAAMSTSASSPELVISPTTQHHEPSSASLTPTSQLPIKERLKAILNSNNKVRKFEEPAVVVTPKCKSKVPKSTRVDDCMERRRAAATRYRNKMRNEYQQLKQKNEELKVENKNLLQRIKELEQRLGKCVDSQSTIVSDVGNTAAYNQLQIPASSIHLVINVPNIVVPSKCL